MNATQTVQNFNAVKADCITHARSAAAIMNLHKTFPGDVRLAVKYLETALAAARTLNDHADFYNGTLAVEPQKPARLGAAAFDPTQPAWSES